MILQSAISSGVPAANPAFRIASEVFAAADVAPDEGSED